jgi:hypothetical protein
MKRLCPDDVLGCSSIDGRVFGWVKPPGLRNVKLLVNSHASLQDFCTKFTNKTLDDFIDRWPH